MSIRNCRRGGVLLGVLWLAAILSILALTLAVQVRGETERSGTLLDQTRAYYVATAGLDRALLQIQWTIGYGANLYKPEITRFPLDFPEGRAEVEILPENAKLDLNSATGEQLARLMLAVGAAPGQAVEIAEAILDWRRPAAAGQLSRFDLLYSQANPPFRASHASFRETEELLMVRGVTPELFYGNYVRTPDGRLIALGGLRDCLSPYAPASPKDINAMEPAVMLALGAPPAGVELVKQIRRLGPVTQANLGPVMQALGPAAAYVGIGGYSIFSLRATGRPRRPDGQLSDTRRTVAGTFKMNKVGVTPPIEVLRWHDHSWVNGETQ